MDSAIQRLSSLHSKCFRAVLEQRTRNESQRPHKKGASKRAGMGWRIKEGNACRQNPGFWKATTWPVRPDCSHQHLMLSSAVIHCILTNKCLTFHRGEVNFWGQLWNQNKISQLVKLFRKQCLDGRNGEISMNPNYQCSLCNCSFKVNFVHICQTSYISTENLFSLSKRKEFNSEVLAQNIQKVEFEVVK